MDKFIDIVNLSDRIIDMIPLASFLTNSCILIYQLAHKVNRIVNPAENPPTCRLDDIKMYFLSKDKFVATLSAIPLIGNLYALVRNAIDLYKLFRGRKVNNIISDAVQADWKIQPSMEEVASLYLARYGRGMPLSKLTEILFAAQQAKNFQAYQLVLSVISFIDSAAIVQIIQNILPEQGNKEYLSLVVEKALETKVQLTAQQQKTVYERFANRLPKNQEEKELIDLVLKIAPTRLDVHALAFSQSPPSLT